ncbi:hypothetical protein INR49_021719 [Caranx melampygus]|nr:hypothetical protein INR49_021719 [Caranx melampygus]
MHKIKPSLSAVLRLPSASQAADTRWGNRLQTAIRAEEWATDAPVIGLLREMDWGSIAHLQSELEYILHLKTTWGRPKVPGSPRRDEMRL